jgi:DNA-binding transcriptional LysR family regulator
VLDKMRLFASILRLGSLSAAGREHGLSPASVSRQINSLEVELGARLLNRSSRGISTTEAGQLFLSRASQILHDVDDTIGMVAEFGQAPTGTLHVHARGLIGSQLVVPVLSGFLRAYPAVDVVLSFSDDPVDLADRNIDVSVQGAKVKGGAFMMRKIGESSRVLCASPEYIAEFGAPASPEELGRHHCLTYRFDLNQPVWRFRNAEGAQAVSIRVKAQLTDGSALRLLALAGAGVAILPRWSVASDIAAGRLAPLMAEYEVSPTASGFGYSIYAVFQPSRQQSPKVRAFIDYLAMCIRKRESDDWR